MAIKIAFDIGGVLSKEPSIWRRMIDTLQRGGAEVYIITDMPDRQEVLDLVSSNGFDVPEERVLTADYNSHEDRCKQILIKEHSIEVFIDDYAGYVAAASEECVSLFVWPRPNKPYNSKDFKSIIG